MIRTHFDICDKFLEQKEQAKKLGFVLLLRVGSFFLARSEDAEVCVYLDTLQEVEAFLEAARFLAEEHI